MSTEKEPAVVYNEPGIFKVGLIVANASGSDQIIRQGFIVVEEPSSIDNAINLDDIKVYPNPNDGLFNVKLETKNRGIFQFIIINHLGKIIYNKCYSGRSTELSWEIDLSPYPKGTYHLQIIDNDNIVHKKIVVN